MTEFTKTKIHFALALLGTLFAVHPYFEQWEHAGFEYLGFRLEILHAYALTGGLLALAVYFYAASLTTERGATGYERAANYLYATGLFVFPLYGLFYVSRLGENYLEHSHLLDPWVSTERLTGWGPAIALGVGVFWLVLSQILAWRVRRRLGRQDRAVKLEQLANEEAMSLGRSREMVAGNHYDLAIVQAWNALEARLKRALLFKGMAIPDKVESSTLIKIAVRSDVIPPKTMAAIDELKKYKDVAISTEPLPRQSAEQGLDLAREILATIALPTSWHG